jgi:hypothetical protein
MYDCMQTSCVSCISLAVQRFNYRQEQSKGWVGHDCLLQEWPDRYYADCTFYYIRAVGL